jgi:hypothetical protein
MVLVGRVEGNEKSRAHVKVAGILWLTVILHLEVAPEQGAGSTGYFRKPASFRRADRLKHKEVAKARPFLLDAALRTLQ